MERLLKVVQLAKGKEKIEALSQLSKIYYSVDPEQGVAYAKQALQLAEELRIPEAKSVAFNNLGINYMALSDFDEARSCFGKAFKNATLYKDSLQISNYFNRMGMMYEFMGKLDSALYVLNKGLIISRKTKNDEQTGKALENIGTIHLNRGELKSAIVNLIEAVKYYEKAGSKNNLPYAYLKLGNVYSLTKDYETSEKWFQKGHDEAMAMGDVPKAALGLNGIGINFMNQKKYVEAVEKYDQALILAEKANNSFLIMTIYGNKGNISRTMKNYPQALSFHLKAFELAKELKQPLKAAIQEFGIGMDYEFMKDYRNASKHYENALTVFKKANAKSNLLTAYEGLISINNRLKEYEKSVQYYIPYLELKDSMNQSELNTSLDSLKLKFNTEHTLNENKILSQKNDLQQKEIRFQRTVLFFAIVLTLLLISLAIIIYRSRLKIKNSNVILAAKNDEISRQAEELRGINTKLNELSQFKDSMNSFLVHDLKNPLNAIINYNSGNKNGQDGSEIKQMGLNMLNIVSNMLDISKYENEIIRLIQENFSLTSIINQAFHEVHYLASSKSIRILLNYSTDYRVHVDQDSIKRVFVNLFTNAIKYSGNGSQIIIMAEPADERDILVKVTDEGEGIDEKFLTIIFDKFTQGSVKKAGMAGSTGIGLTYCKMAVESHGGKIGVESSPGKGSCFWFSLPLSDKQESLLNVHQIMEDQHTESFDNLLLTTNDKLLLEPLCRQLQSIMVYQISDIQDVLASTSFESAGLTGWKECVLQAVNNCNETTYNKLININ